MKYIVEIRLSEIDESWYPIIDMKLSTTSAMTRYFNSTEECEHFVKNTLKENNENLYRILEVEDEVGE
jgi:hypothetical protein